MELYIRNRYDAQGHILPKGYRAKEADALKEFLKEHSLNQIKQAEDAHRHPCDPISAAV